MSNSFTNISELVAGSAQITDGSIVNADINASAAIAATKIADGSVDNTEFQYLNGTTGIIQTQLDSRPRVISVSGTDQTLNTSSTITTIYSFTLPANTLSTDARWLQLWIPFQHTTDQSVTLTFTLTLAGIVISTYTTGSISSGTRNGKYTAAIRRDGANNKTVVLADNTLNTGFSATDLDSTTDGTLAIDLTTAMTLAVRVTHSVNAAAVGITTKGYTAIVEQA